MRMSEWIDPDLHGDFISQETDALRLCTATDGWVERYGVDVLISHKTEAALERLKTELCLWALNLDFKFRRVFARFLPKQNADREAPTLILGDPDTNLESTALERSLRYAIVLDPPTFSRTHRGKTFQVEQDFERLLLAALEVAERRARILLSTNCSTLGDRVLEVMGRFCLKATRRAGDFHREAPLPDFPS